MTLSFDSSPGGDRPFTWSQHMAGGSQSSPAYTLNAYRAVNWSGSGKATKSRVEIKAQNRTKAESRWDAGIDQLCRAELGVKRSAELRPYSPLPRGSILLLSPWIRIHFSDTPSPNAPSSLVWRGPLASLLRRAHKHRLPKLCGALFGLGSTLSDPSVCFSRWNGNESANLTE